MNSNEISLIVSRMFDLKRELASFEGVWNGGYYEGDPLDPLSRSTYGQIGYLSVLHATYLRCIKPYIRPDTVALEIGPGRGAWTKALLPAKEVWTLDALSAEHNGFWKYVGFQPHVHYVRVEDFECRDLPDNHFTYMFSFGTLCHVPFEGIAAYARSILPKLRPGADCFWMIADFAQFNRVVADAPRHSVLRALPPPIAKLLDLKRRWRPGSNLTPISDAVEATTLARWHDAGVEHTCSMLKSTGYEIADPNVGTTPRDPIIHFRNPMIA